MQDSHIFRISHEAFCNAFHRMHWEPMKERQQKSREAFEIKLSDTIHDYWQPGPRKQGGLIALVDFSVEGVITLQLFEKEKGDKSNIAASGENRQLLRQHRIWADVRATEIFGIKYSKLELIKDPFHTYTVYSTNCVDTFHIPINNERLRKIQWMYDEECPYIT